MGGGQIREGSELVPEKPHYSDEYASSVLRLAIQNPDLVSAQVGGGRVALALRGRYTLAKLVRLMDETRCQFLKP